MWNIILHVLKLFSALLCTWYACNDMLYTIKMCPWAMKQLLRESMGMYSSTLILHGIMLWRETLIYHEEHCNHLPQLCNYLQNANATTSSVVPIHTFTCSISFCSPGVVIGVVLCWIILLMLPSSWDATESLLQATVWWLSGWSSLLVLLVTLQYPLVWPENCSFM